MAGWILSEQAGHGLAWHAEWQTADKRAVDKLSRAGADTRRQVVQLAPCFQQNLMIDVTSFNILKLSKIRLLTVYLPIQFITNHKIKIIMFLFRAS